ncbi:MAG: hypothetical protein WCP53_00805, partial [Verrucomicrobiota bacterium]
MEKRLAEWGTDDEEEESEDGATANKGLSEKKKRKLHAQKNALTVYRPLFIIDAPAKYFFPPVAP